MQWRISRVTHAGMHTRIVTCGHAHTHTFTWSHTSRRTQTPIESHTRAQMHVHTHTHWVMHTGLYTQTHTCCAHTVRCDMHADISFSLSHSHMYTQTHTQAYISTDTRTHKHTHKHSHTISNFHVILSHSPSLSYSLSQTWCIVSVRSPFCQSAVILFCYFLPSLFLSILTHPLSLLSSYLTAPSSPQSDVLFILFSEIFYFGECSAEMGRLLSNS